MGSGADSGVNEGTIDEEPSTVVCACFVRVGGGEKVDPERHLLAYIKL